MKRTFLSTLTAACLTFGLACTINVTSALVAPTTAHAGVLGKIKGAVKSVGHHVKKAGGAVMKTGQDIGNKVGPVAVVQTIGKGAVAGAKVVGKGAVAGAKVVGKGAVAGGKAVGRLAVQTGQGAASGAKAVAKGLKPKT